MSANPAAMLLVAGSGVGMVEGALTEYLYHGHTATRILGHASEVILEEPDDVIDVVENRPPSGIVQVGNDLFAAQPRLNQCSRNHRG